MGYSKWNFHFGTLTCCPFPRCIDYQLTIDRPSKVISRIRRTFACGIWNPENVFFWNPESWALESAIQLKESGYLANDCNPKSKFRWQGIRSPVPKIQNLRLFWWWNWPALCFCLITVNSLLSPPLSNKPPVCRNPSPFQGKKVNKPPFPPLIILH